MNAPHENPKPVLKARIIYLADNGMLICLECAGMSAKFTGRDRSGHKVHRVPVSETVEWKRMTGHDMKCEGGCTTYLQPVP